MEVTINYNGQAVAVEDYILARILRWQNICKGRIRSLPHFSSNFTPKSVKLGACFTIC